MNLIFLIANHLSLESLAENLHLNYLINYLFYNDVGDKIADVIYKGVKVLSKIAIPSAVFSVTIGGIIWIWGGEEGKTKAKKWWIGTAIGLSVVLSAITIVGWFQSNARF